MSGQTPATPAPKHREASPRGLQIARIVLLSGAVLSGAAAAGPVWLVRAAVVLAVSAGVLAVVAVSRDRAERHRDEQQRLRATERRHRDQLSEERARSTASLTVLDERLDAERRQRRTLQHRVAELRTELVERDATIAELRARESGLLQASLLGDLRDDHAEVHALPRHAVSRIVGGDRSWGNLEVEIPGQAAGS